MIKKSLIFYNLVKFIFQKKHFIIALLFFLFIVGGKKAPAAIEPFSDEIYLPQAGKSESLETFDYHNFSNLLDIGSISMWGAYNQNNQLVKAGASQIAMNITGIMYQGKPVSSELYIADLKNNMGLTKKAHAVGSGSEFLKPTLIFWKALRNLTYLFYTIIFLAVGFMIMFRTKLNPQLVVSVQNALPKIVVSLLAVTFSFAICGLMVDLVYFGNAMVTTIFSDPVDASLTLVKTTSWPTAKNLSVLDLIDPTKTGPWAGFNVIQRLVGGLKSIFTGVGGPTSMKGLIQLVMAFVLLSTTLKIFFALLSRYVSIIMLTIFSPLVMLWGALPGQQDTVPKYLKNFLVSVLTFPAVYLFINLSGAIANPASTFDATNLPPFTLPGGVGLDSYASVVGLGILMIIPQIPAAIEDALAVKPSSLGQVGGQELSGALRKIPIIGSLVG